MSNNILKEGNSAPYQDNSRQLATLNEQLNELLNTNDPFTFRDKLEVLLTYPLSVQRLLVRQYPLEQNIIRQENMIMIMGSAGEIISQQQEITDEENKLLLQSINYIVDAIRNTEYLAIHMTAAHALLRFNIQHEQYFDLLRSLASDMFGVLTMNNTHNVHLQKYKARSFPIDNDLLENIIEKLQEHGKNDNDFLQKLADQDTSSEHSLRLRTIYKARTYLGLPKDQNPKKNSVQTGEIQPFIKQNSNMEKPLNYLVGILYNSVPDAGVIVQGYDIDALLSTPYIYEEDLVDYQREIGAIKAICFKPGIVDECNREYTEYMLIDGNNRPMSVIKRKRDISYSRIYYYDQLGRLVKVIEDTGFIDTIIHTIHYSSDNPDNSGHFLYTVEKKVTSSLQ